MNENNNLNINNDQVQNINTHVVNQDINNVIAINEVKIESDTVIPEVSNEIPTVSNNNEPPKNSKVSTILLVLLFIFLFGFVMGMPYINEFINNLKNDNSLSEIEQEAIREEEKQQQEQQNQKPVEVPEKEKTTLLTCTINSASNNEYSLVQIQKFNYNSNNQIE